MEQVQVRPGTTWFVSADVPVVPTAKPTVFDVARENGWEFGKRGVRIFGYGERVTQVEDKNGWRLFPYKQFDSNIPAEGYKRILTLLEAGVFTDLDDLFVADDLSKRKYQPPKPKPWETMAWKKVRGRVDNTVESVTETVAETASKVGLAAAKVDWEKVGSKVGSVAETTAKVGLVTAGVVGLVAIHAFAIAATGVFVFDPVLCLATNYNGRPTWVAFFEWLEK